MSGLLDFIGTVEVRLAGWMAAGLLVVSCSPSTVPTSPDKALATIARWGAEAGPAERVSPELESQVVGAINEFRARNGRRTMGRHGGLDALAREHAGAMRRSGTLSHDGFFRRAEAGRRHYGMEWMAENVSWGDGVPEEELGQHIVDGWIGSSGHRENLLMTNESIGIAIARGEDGSFWAVQVSARRGD